MSEVDLGIDLCLFWVLEEVEDLGKGILFFFCEFIETSEVNAKSESTILLLAEKYQSSVGR
jgi:hypothetical protein